MEFIKFKEALQENFKEMTKDISHLFEVDVDKEKLWNLYLDSFPEGTNNMFRQRREYDCSCCRQFIKNIGNAVVIKDGKVSTVWDFKIDIEKFQVVADALSKYIKSKAVADVYISRFKTVGTDSNYEDIEGGQVIKWDHFYLELEDKFVNRSRSKSEAEIKGSYRDTRNVFKRSLDEITEDSILTVLELISSNTLYKGEEWQGVLNEFLKYKKAYDKLKTNKAKEIFTWEQSVKAGISIGRIKNHSIGTLLINISEGMDLDVAVRKYEVIVAPTNYKRPKAIFTKKMLEDAQNTIQELGYMDALGRRCATLDDISVNNILFSNKDSAKRMRDRNVFEDMLSEAVSSPKKFSKVEEIDIESFIKNILPSAKELEVYVENKHSNSFVSLIAPKNEGSKNMLKWNNNFSWAYTGNITDSSMKENVKAAGGNVEGVLRFSIQWNDEEDYNSNDFDAHCIQPGNKKIYFGASYDSHTTGELDVDIRYPNKGVAAVENITWSNRSKMSKGEYKFLVNNFSHRGGRSGFKAEIEYDGQVFSFNYNKELRSGENVEVAIVNFDGVNFTIKELLPSTTSSKDVWNINTNNFIPVSVMMYSPNYWDDQNGIGHKHYFFMLKDCVNQECPNGFYNEFLKEDLMKHRRVFEALGAKMRVEEIDGQLSGLGFSSTRRNKLIVKVKGNIERVVKIKF